MISFYYKKEKQLRLRKNSYGNQLFRSSTKTTVKHGCKSGFDWVACLVIIVWFLSSFNQKKCGTRTQRQATNHESKNSNTTIVNEGKSFIADVLIADGVIRHR
jgi:hypothetical protein